MPRRAGISSFGAGGVNAHVIVEEWTATPALPASREIDVPKWFVFSARDTDRLRELVAHFVEFAAQSEFDAENAAYTLKVGRTHFEERLAVAAANGVALASKLRGWLSGAPVDGLISGSARRPQQSGMVESSDEGELVRAWIAGADVNWTRLYDGAPRKRIHLPTYRFARERHWVTLSAAQPATALPALHPMIDANCSSFEGLAFRKTFLATDSIVRDHVISGRHIVPGVAWIEMMLAAAEMASGRSAAGIEEFTWRRPVECEPTSGEVRLRITLEDDSRARCELSVESESRNELIARGTAIWSDGVPLEQLRRDIAQVRASCEQHRDEAFCYRALKQAGLDYGPALRGLRDLFLGDAVMLARLAVAPSETADARIKLPVALLDGAFQAAALTAIGALPANANTLLPLRFGALRVYGPAPSEAWAVIERRVPESDANENLFVYDLVLTDADGTPWADVRGFTLKAARPAAASMLTKVHLFRPEWITMPLSNAGAQPANVSTRVLVASSSRLPSVPPGWDVLHVTPGTSFSVAADQIALDPRDPEHFTRLWQSLSLREWHPDLVLHLWTFSSPAASASGAPEDRLTTLFNLVSTGLRTGWAKRDVQWLHVYPSDDGLGAACSAAIAGFARSVQLEQPRCRGRVMAVAQDLCDEAPALWSAIQAELAWTEGDVEIRIDERRREVRRFVAWSPPLRDLAPGALRRDGAWVLTGGAGGLGLIFAEEMLRLGVSAIVLVGRKAPDAGLEQRLIELRAHSAQVEYVAADITDQLQVQALLASVRQRHGCIRGVIHSAAVLRDAFVLKKTPDAFASVLAPKIRGAIHLDLATRDDDLDAFVLFSSTAAVTGNAGQADYAAGNRFMDELATWRNQQTASGHRRGAAISIAWPLWREGGMQVNEVAERALRERLGMTPLSTQNGLVAFRTALANRIEQLVVVEGETADVTAAFASAPAVAAAPLAPVIAGTEADVAKLRAEVERYLRSLVAQESGVAPGRLEPDAPLERYGLDSVMVMSLNRHLEKDLPGLSKTLLYEYQTLAALTDHLLETRAQQLQAKFAPASSPVGTAANVAAVPKATPPFASRAAAVDDVRPLQAQPDASDIAIIGVSGRYPHAREWRDLWTVLAAGRDCITEIPPERWDYRRYYDPVKGRPGRTYGKWGGFIDGHDEFDPLFFNISPREAEMMDPQERLFLQAAWHAIEDAGYRKSDLEREPVGVFAGAMWAHYQMVGVNECLAGAGEAPTALHASIANRVSYCFNFRGPSISLDTMCSSSLTALHLACESLRRDECTVALAGGVNVCAHPVKYQLLAQNGMLATDGRCRSFGARGDGYVPGEGVGVLLLKPLHQALRDGDHVYGVIKGSVVNHGGKTNGYTVPNPLAQADVIRTALRRAAVEPASISYVEAHGTGTALGDPIEINGLERAFAGAWPGAGSCAVGSIKSNIGHLESAAGVAAITKVLLQFMHEKLAPSLHSTELNPNIDFSRSPFRVVRDLEDWARPSSEADVTTWPRRAGVSSFGAGGANAHVVLEEAPAAPVEPADAMPQLIVLSAKNPERLQAAAEKLAAWFEEHGRAPHRPSLADIAWTLQIGREEMDTRVAFVARDYEEARELALRVARAEQDDARLKRGERSDLVGVVRALLDGAAGQAFVAQLFSTCDWNKLAELWVAGLAIDWRRLHTRPHRRVPLPGYRFSAQRFWVPNVVADASAPVQKQTPRAAIPAVTTTTTLATGDLPEDLFLVRDWRPVARLGAVDEEPGVRGLLLVNAECPSALVDEARRRQWLIVQAGSELHFDPLGTSTMDFSSAEHGRLMMERILSAGPPLNAAIDLADVWSEPREAWTVDMGRVTLLQGCLSAPSRGPLQWLHVTNGVHTFSHSAPSMAGAAMAGLVKMLSAECSRVRAQTADLERSPATFDDVRAIWAGARSGPADEVEVCYRGGVRYVPGFRRLQLAPTAELPRIREDRAYLITGGTSGLGLEVARHLVARGARRLALMGINPLPSRAKWSEILATADARTRRRLETFAGFERDGVSIETHFGALDDGDAVASFIARVTQQLGPIAGVVHSATATFNRPDPYFISKTSEEIHGVLAPKLEGTRQLAALLEHQALDFFVLFSSVASALPSRGQGVSHYAMANSFLDRFAEQQAARGHRQIKCINWVYWGEAGGVAGDEHARKLARYGIFAQTNSEGLASFDRALAMHAPRVLAGRLGDTLRAEARLDDAICRETATEETSLGDAAVLEQCAIHHAQGLARLGSERTSQSELSEYAALALLRAMRSRRVLTAAGRRYGVAELAAQLGVVERQTRLWRALLALLAKKQFIHFVDADNFVSADRLESDALNEALASLPALGQSFASRHAGFASYIRLIDTAMASVWEVLRAERSATDILFARGSVELVEAVYQGNPISDHFNHLLARAAYEWLSAGRSSGRRLRVLEVGAGTGGTSARVLDALRPLASQIEYVYTDISSRFIQHGESRFGRDYPFATFRTLDIERSLDAQGFASGEFDLVLATNVMHATRRLDRSLGELQRLLRPGGLFLLNELTEVHDFATVTFGLLDGWWQFDDEVLRLRDAPLLSESSWRAALRTCGFDAIRTWTLPSLTEAEGNYQTLFAAVAGARRIELVTATPVVSTGVSRISRDVTPTTRAPASLEQEITEVLARELKIPAQELGPDVEFGEYGVDSILIGTLVRALEERLNVSVNPSLLLENNTLSKLSRRLQQELPDAAHAVVVESPRSLVASSPPMSNAGKIAVIGLSCDFPGAPNLETYWWNLKEGRCAIQEVPAERWRVSGLYSSVAARGKSISKWGGFVENVAQFDPEYFKFRDSDAAVVNPLIRKLLESAVQAVCHAGYKQGELWGQRAGVFVGTRINEYGLQLHGHHKNRILGAGQNFVAAHLSQFLNLRGPSLVVDSACSSSLVSLHLACQSLLSGDSTVAFAGGVDLLLDERPYLILSEMGALSPEGRCRTFDERANGFVPGEGCGVVMLKTLEAALADGDAIYAVIDGSAVNNDGHTMGVTTPSPEAQSAVITEALKRSGVDPRTIGYVETHGTGTLVGDPIELQALTRVLAAGSTDRQFCGVGSVKSNFGHLLSAAGIASFIKVVLGLGAGKIPPTLFCDAPNPRFSFPSSPLYPVRELTPWPRHGELRRAGVSSFGLGGTNAHVIVSEAPLDAAASSRRQPLPPIVFKRRRFWSEATPVATMSRGSEVTRLEPVPVSLPSKSLSEADSTLELIEDAIVD
jgi:acyl transferase domain-containing protein/SAM-dependent methyltransferase/acyl carrier protein